MSRRSEFALIAAFRERLPGPHAGVVVGSGDDAAVVRAGGALSVVSVDTTVDGVHARLDLGDPIQTARDFGWRGLTTALSDLAACGVGAGRGDGDSRSSAAPGNPRDTGDASDGRLGSTEDGPTESGPTPESGPSPASPSFVWELPADTPAPAGIEVYVAVTLPNGLGDDRILAIADGMADAARAYGASVIGGDVTAGPVAVMSTTVVGWLDDRPLTRAGAKPGDLVGLTGAIGAAGAGLALTIGEVALTAVSDPALAASLRTAYQRPVPHFAAGAALRELGATAAIDLSDGLAADARHVADASGVVLALGADAIPIAEG
ncbi:MAG: thiamine-phosphate kinase, partial [Solirubrobacteraceae bacterium]|nr:thiamine-phosphate kinase [Solirubrobacteraceae bacterium]